MIFTAFCRQANNCGTTWISTVEAESPDEAATVAVEKCATGWDHDPEDVSCIGIAEGDVNILMWDDQE